MHSIHVQNPVVYVVMDITHEVACPTIVTSQGVTQMSNKVSKKLKMIQFVVYKHSK